MDSKVMNKILETDVFKLPICPMYPGDIFSFDFKTISKDSETNFTHLDIAYTTSTATTYYAIAVAAEANPGIKRYEVNMGRHCIYLYPYKDYEILPVKISRDLCKHGSCINYSLNNLDYCSKHFNEHR